MNPSLIGTTRCAVTSWRLNFVELFFCQLRCNARYDRPHKYPLVVNIWARSGSPWRAFRHLAPGYPQVGCLCSFLDGSNVARDGVATCSCLYWGVQSYLYAIMDSASSSVSSTCFWSQRLPTSSFLHQ